MSTAEAQPTPGTIAALTEQMRQLTQSTRDLGRKMDALPDSMAEIYVRKDVLNPQIADMRRDVDKLIDSRENDQKAREEDLKARRNIYITLGMFALSQVILISLTVVGWFITRVR